jgi:predicted unusual protein kinase regulating ubiquinone biosynthesis (AarF/ABC1/UbiB family)
MRSKIFRRFLLIRLALSFVVDYWRIRRLNKKWQGEQLKAAVDQVYANAGKRMCLTAFRLKGVIVKAGQFLSMRQDILPQAFTSQLEDLQDSIPAAPFTAVRPLIEQELKRKLHRVFKTFDEEAIAAASLAQVHKAVLLDGAEVAVKIFRPRMEKLIQVDLGTLGIIAKVTQRFPSFTHKMNFVELHRQFKETIERELDCRQELIHLQRFEEIFSNDKRIAVPKAYEEYTTQRLLVMEYVEGVRITDRKHLAEWGVNGLSIAETLLEAYFRQFLVYGFIHVDPHPGNLLVLPDQRLCFLDFGMINELTTDEVHTLRKLMQSILMRDLEGILIAFVQLGFLPSNVDRDQFKPMISQLLNRLNGDGNHQTPALGAVAAGMRSFLHESPIQLQAKYMLLIRCTGILITTLTILAPHNNWYESLMKVGPSVFMEPVEIK